MKQTKQFLRPLLMAIVMLVGMLVPQGAWAQELEVWEEEPKTISSDASYDMIYVYPGGMLIINEGVTLTVTGNLYIHGDDNMNLYGKVINYGTIKGGEASIYMNGGVLANHGHIDLGGGGSGYGTFYNTGTLGDGYFFLTTTPCDHDYEDLGEVDATCTHGAGTQKRCYMCYYMWLDETGDPSPHSFNSHNGMNICSSCGHTTYDAPTVGIGTAESPYQIANAGHLFWFADKVNNDFDNFKDANAVLTADIVVNDGAFAANGAFTATGASEPSTPIEWLIIGRFDIYSHGYRGTFDGQGHTISGLYANYSCSGLVGMSSGESKIKNVGVTNSYFSGHFVGGICGDAGDNTEISNCYSSNVICKGNYVGGILGLVANTGVSIVNCYSTASLIGVEDWAEVGGITAQSCSTTNCYTTYGNATGWSESEINCEANVSLERFASGEIAYKLNGSVDGEGSWTAGATNGTQKWYQAIGTDAAPVFVSNGSNTVYEQKTIDCGGTVVACNYNNTVEEDVTQPHDYHVLLDENSNPVFVWSEDYTTATLQVVCSHDAEHTANVEVTGEGITWVDTPATCTAVGVRTYTATATYEGETYTGTAIEAIEPIAEHTLDEHNVCTECGHGFIFFEKEVSYDIEPNIRYAFSNSEGSVEYIGNTTFNEWMYAFEFSGLVTEIGNNAFSSREALTAIYLPEVTTIGDNAFSGCALRDNVSLPKATTIGQAAFLGCGFQTLSLPEATTIGYMAFGSCGNLSSIELPKATTIGVNAFMECDNLNSITVACAADLSGAKIPEEATITRVHDFSSKTLTDEPVADGLYAYACDRGCGAHSDDHIVKGDGDGNTIALTANTVGETTTYTAANVTLEDGKAFSTPVEFTTSNVTMARTFTQSVGDAVVPATIMLPFSIEANKLATVNGDVVTGTKFYGFTSLTKNAETGKWEANMDRVTGTIQAHTPYMIVLTEGTAIDFGSNEVTFPKTPESNNDTQQEDWTFVATNEAKVWTEADFANGEVYYGFAAGNETTPEGKFVKVGAGASIDPLRAYIMKTPAAGPANAPTRAMTASQVPSTISVRLNEAAVTGIGTLNIETGEFTFDGWYDLQGRRISEPVKNGISINNGKKIMVK